MVTNPPFSLFREFVDLMTTHNKQFLVVGSMNAITYKDVFRHIKDNNLWLGINPVKEFTTPEGGIKKFGNILWFTNMNHKKRNEKLFLVERYCPEKYPTYDNYKAINVDKVKDIPEDYYEAMGVPITFLTKYTPEQFEILGMTSGRYEFDIHPTKRYANALQHNADGTTVSGSKANTRAMILLPSKPLKGVYYTDGVGGCPMKMMYARIIIKRKQKDQYWVLN